MFGFERRKWLRKAEKFARHAREFSRAHELLKSLGHGDSQPARVISNHVVFLSQKARYYVGKVRGE